MDYVTIIIQLISNLGFPIVVCGALFYYILKQDEKMETRDKDYQDKLDKMTDALNANSTVIAEFRAFIVNEENGKLQS